jgi:uncharacterized protein YkwD
MRTIPFVLFFWMTSFSNRQALPEGATGSMRISAVNKTLILKLVNEAREKGVRCGNDYYKPAPPVVWNDLLEKAALTHCTDMAAKKYFSHTSNNGSGSGDRLRKAGYNWMACAENIGMGYMDEKEMVEGWLKSPGHCRNIMNPDYKEMGVARVGDYWTQEFGSR